MRLPASLAAVALALLAACGGPLLSAEVEVERFCYAQRVCPASPPAATSNCLPPMPTVPAAATIPGNLLPPLTVPLQLPPLLRNKGSEVEIRLLEARVRPVSATTDLRGVVSLDLSIQPASGAAVSVAHYARPVPAPASVPTLALGGQRVDVVGYLQGGQMQVRLGGAYDAPFPAAAWDADLELCFYGRALMPYF